MLYCRKSLKKLTAMIETSEKQTFSETNVKPKKKKCVCVFVIISLNVDNLLIVTSRISGIGNPHTGKVT